MSHLYSHHQLWHVHGGTANDALHVLYEKPCAAELAQVSVCAKPVQTEPALTMQDARRQEEAHHGEPGSSQAHADRS